MTETVTPLIEISQGLLAMQERQLPNNLSEIIAKVEKLLESILQNPKHPCFEDAIGLQFSFLDALKTRKRISVKEHQQQCLEQINKFLKLDTLNADIREFLKRKELKVLEPNSPKPPVI